MELSDQSKMMSSINVNDKDMPAMKNHKVGSKHKFMVEAEHVSSRKNEHDMYPIMSGGAPKKPEHTMTGMYRIHSITPMNDKSVEFPAQKKSSITVKKAVKKIVKAKPRNKQVVPAKKNPRY